MKTTIRYKAFGSRAARGLFVLALALPLAFTSCKKDGAVNSEVTDEEVAEVMVQAVDPASGGMVTQTEYAVEASVAAKDYSCGSTKDTTVAGSYSTGIRTYSYSLNWQNSLNCLGGDASQFAMTFSGTSVYNGPRMSSDDSSVGEFVVSGIEGSSPAVTMSQIYKRQGTQQSKIRNNRTFTTTVNITTSNLKVDKATQKILSGTATATVQGSASGVGSFTRSGTITFLGNGKARVEAGSGTYTIQW